MSEPNLNTNVISAFAELAYAILMMDGIIDEAEEHIISTKLKGTEIMAPLDRLIQGKAEIMITEAYQNLNNLLQDQPEPGIYLSFFNALEQLAGAGEVLDEDDADILLSILNNLKNRIS